MTAIANKNWKSTFFMITIGQGVSDFSSSLVSFALIWALVENTSSPMIVSIALIAEFFPGAVIGPFAGAIIDRHSRKQIMIISDILISVVGIAFVLFERVKIAPPWILIAVIGLRAIGSAFQRPCLQAVIPQVVPKKELFRCAGLSQTIQSASRLLSPGVAAGLFLIWGIGHFVLLDIVGSILAIATLIIVKIPTMVKSQYTQTTYIKDIGDGVRVLAKNKPMLGVVLTGALYAFALTPVSALFPLMSLEYFGGSSVQAGTVEMFFAAGSLLGALFLSVKGGFKIKIYNIIAVFFLMTACLVISGLLPPTGIMIFMAVALFMGVCAPNYYGSQTALLQQNFAQEYMGRVMALTAAIRFITSPLSLLLSGFLSEMFGNQVWFLVGGSLTFACALLTLFNRSMSSLRRREQE